jgi:hypothetical protein
MPSTRHSNGILTFFDYTEEDIDKLRAFAQQHCKYLVYGKEVCITTGRPHVHAVFQLKQQKPISLSQKLLHPKVCDLKFPLRALNPESAHFAPNYAKKGSQSHEEWEQLGSDGPAFGLYYSGEEFGEWVGSGQRTDIAKLQQGINEARNWKEVLDNAEISDTVCRHLNYAKELFAKKRPHQMSWAELTGLDDAEPREWQQDVLNMVTRPCTDNRKIYSFVDPVGGAGKSILCNFLIRNHGAIVLSGKGTDMFCAYDMEPIIIIDCPRDSMEYFNYGAIEKLKDGVFFSAKYNSQMKVRDYPAHVLIFSNIELDATKWSRDRMVVKWLSEPADMTDQFGAE